MLYSNTKKYLQGLTAAVFLAVSLLVFSSAPVNAQNAAECGRAGGTWNGSSCTGLTPKATSCFGTGGAWDQAGSQCTTPGAGTLEGGLRNVINILLFLVGIIAVIMIVVGGLRYVLSNGDSSAISSAKNTVLYAVIGLVVAILAYAIINFVLGNI